jgi:nucleoside-diphosphate-sugar epimerase
MLDLAEEMQKYFPRRDLFCTMKLRVGDVYYSQATISDARRVLNYFPQHDLRKDIKDYCEYIIANKDKFISNSWAEENARMEARGLQ